MGSIRDQLKENAINLLLFNTHTFDKDENEIPTYVSEGYDREKIEAEGSTWIMYVYACMNDYYEKHKEEIDEMVNDELRNALKEG